MPGTLEDMVTAAAAELMAATAGDSAAISERVLRYLVRRLGVDVGFLRHNDHTIHATVLVAQWPPRENIPDPDPLGVVYFADADPIFARAENYKEPFVLRPEPANADYQGFIQEATGVPISSLAGVPLLSGELVTGTLGFVKFGEREWLPEELNALQAIATLFAQLQARIIAEEQVHYLAEHDDLTGLLNRRALIAHLDHRLAEGQQGPVALLFLDLDRFKVVNEHLGQHVGDRFIRGFAQLLREAADGTSVTARFGGDEFVVVPSARMNIKSAVAFAHWLHERLDEQVMVGREKLGRTVSVGVAVGVPGYDNPSDLLRRADQALRSAKRSGGATVEAFSATMSGREAIGNDIEMDLEQTTDTGPMVLHYLPEFGIPSGEVLGAEALIRWQHPTRGLLTPESFTGLLDSIHLGGKLSRLVLRAACAQFGTWRARGLGRETMLRVNISPMQLVADNMVDTVTATLDEFGVDPGMLCLEITERVVVQEIDTTRRTLTRLKDIGVQVAIDDFGTGYSSLGYLKSLPVDTLKIDRGFVRDLGTSKHDRAIVAAIVALADAFELEVVAEGVETVSAARTLLQLGCYRAQGFLLSRPLDSAAMEWLLTRRPEPMDFATMRDAPTSNTRGLGVSTPGTSTRVGTRPLS
jgi:diguanylate cyclase (GGDEF)-like protein